MISFLVELWLAQHADIHLRRDLIRVFRLMFAIPAADWFDIPVKIREEPSSRYLDVSAESTCIISSSEKHQMVEVQEGFESLIAEKVNVVIQECVKKFVRRQRRSRRLAPNSPV